MILNRASDGLLSVLIVLRRALVAYGPMHRDRLVELCAPPSAVKNDLQVTQTLNRWIQLGVFVESGSRVRLTDEFARIDVDDLESFRTALLALVLRPDSNPPIKVDDEGTVEEGPGATDFTLAAAWALQQDPYTFASVKAVEHERQQGVSPELFSNPTRWDGFRDWAHFLGIALPFGSRPARLLLNPARAIRSVLPSVVPPGERHRIDSILELIAEQLPVLDGGRYGQELIQRTARPWRRLGPTEVSPCLSLALRQLRHEGLIRTEDLSDAPKRFALLGRNGRTLESVTHISRELP